MIFNINPDAGEPIFEQIINGVVFGILRGVWRSGDQIPSRRDMAGQLRVNPNTVMVAYRRLEALGIVENHRGRGLFVTDKAAGAVREYRSRTLMKKFRQLVDMAHEADLSDMEINTLLQKILEDKAQEEETK